LASPLLSLPATTLAALHEPVNVIRHQQRMGLNNEELA